VAAVGAVAAASALAAFLTWTTTYDYADDAGPPIDALIHGRWHEFLAARPVMGPFSLFVRAPFAALAELTGGGDARHLYESANKFGIFPCLLAAGLLGLWLARIMGERGHRGAKQFVVVGLCMFTPASVKALSYGHAEEVLGAALATGAVVAGIRNRPRLAILLLACTILNKQWGLLAALPVLLTLQRRDTRLALYALAGLAVALAPFAIVDHDSLVRLMRGIADVRGTFVLPANIWWPFLDSSPDLPEWQHVVPGWLGAWSRPMLVAICLVVPLLLARRVRQDLVSRALPLLALVLLMRCVLDPLNNVYYHAPFLMALVAADALTGRLAGSLTAVACVYLTVQVGADASSLALSITYIAWSIPMCVYLAGRAGGMDWRSGWAASLLANRPPGTRVLSLGGQGLRRDR
jgi:hypothetical protein